MGIFLASPAYTQSIMTLHENGEGPSRLYHVVHYKIDVRLDEVNKSVSGTVTTTIVPYVNDFRTVVLDAEEMAIERCSVGKNTLSFDTTAATLSIHLDRPYSIHDTVRVAVQYHCTPKRGMFFFQPDSAYPDRRWQIWSQGESNTNHFWFPCYDFPNEKSTSEVIATVNKKFTVLSNGKLLGVTDHKKEGTRTFHWKEGKPHSSYLIMVAAGEYAILHDAVGKLPVDYYVYPEDTTTARIEFRQTPAMIRFFDRVTGFPYPWEKYGQILCQDHFGGMENTSATTLADGWAVPDRRSLIDDTATGLIAHELSHQWWGDVVTCKDWRHLWLNESFASYFDPLYEEYARGKEEFDYSMFNDQQSGIRVDTVRGRKPIVSDESYGENLYPRGAAVLHMLRFVLGDTLFWKAINHYITKYQFMPVETNDFKTAIEEATGQNLYWFFDEWVYKAGHPVFDLKYSWDETSKLVALSVKQTQKMDSLTGVFRMPVDVEITTSSGSTLHHLQILSKDTIFTLPADGKPLLVIFDKGNWLLKEVHFAKSDDEFRYQAVRASHVIARLRAVQAMANSDHAAQFLPTIAQVMTDDPFWAVRREAITQSEKITPENEAARTLLKDALSRAMGDVKPAVRAAAVSRLGTLKGVDAGELITKALTDSSYNVLQTALRSLAAADSTRAIPTLRKFLTYPSFRNRVASAALGAIASVDSVEGMTLGQTYASYGQPMETRNVAVGILSRYAKRHANIAEYLQSFLPNKKDRIRMRLMFTFGEIGDESTIALLEPISKDKDDPVSGAAKGAIERIKKRLEEKNKKPATNEKK